jgi:hypothetical protein
MMVTRAVILSFVNLFTLIFLKIQPLIYKAFKIFCALKIISAQNLSNRGQLNLQVRETGVTCPVPGMNNIYNL